jgi:CBS domain-containing protein
MSYLVKDYMRKDVVTVDSGASALEASKIMTGKNSGYVIILEKSKPVGIVTEKDLVAKVLAKEKNPLNTKVSEVMSVPLITVNLDATIEDAVRTMAKHRIRRLPIARNSIIYGIFTTRDLARNFSKYEDRITKDLANVQEPYDIFPELSFYKN